MMEINFRRLLFQVGERERTMNYKNLNSKKKKKKKKRRKTTVLPRPKKERAECKEINWKNKKKKKRCATLAEEGDKGKKRTQLLRQKKNATSQPRRTEKRRTPNIERQAAG